MFLTLQTVSTNAQTHKLLIGTYTNKGNSEGIYIYDFDTRNGDFTLLNIIKNISNPSYLALSRNQAYIYSIQEAGTKSAVSAYHFNLATSETKFLNTVATAGADPCFILAGDKYVFTANYSGGSVNVFGIKADGSLTELIQTLQHTGKGPDNRQKSAHVHQVVFSPDKKYIFATDLGEDKIYCYAYNASDDQPLTLKNTFQTNITTGPRHLTFSPKGKYAYLTHEFNGKISVLSYANGNLTLQQEIATVAEDYIGKIDGADIHTSADGKFLYQSNRGDANSLNVFAIQKNGKLQFVESVSSLGKGPRNFTIDPSGKHLLVAHQASNDVVIFNRDQKTGKLTDSGKKINVGVPVCLVFSK